MSDQKCVSWDFPGGRVAKNPSSNAGGVGSIPGQETKIPHAATKIWCSQNIFFEYVFSNKRKFAGKALIVKTWFTSLTLTLPNIFSCPFFPHLPKKGTRVENLVRAGLNFRPVSGCKGNSNYWIWKLIKVSFWQCLELKFSVCAACKTVCNLEVEYFQSLFSDMAWPWFWRRRSQSKDMKCSACIQ